jgi:uncharacterized protein (DUF1810 family)
MIAKVEGSETNLAMTTDGAEAQTGANGGRIPQILGKPEPWQLNALLLLQQRAKDAQRDLVAAMQAFQPVPGCSLENGEWVK